MKNSFLISALLYNQCRLHVGMSFATRDTAVDGVFTWFFRGKGSFAFTFYIHIKFVNRNPVHAFFICKGNSNFLTGSYSVFILVKFEIGCCYIKFIACCSRLIVIGTYNITRIAFVTATACRKKQKKPQS